YRGRRAPRRRGPSCRSASRRRRHQAGSRPTAARTTGRPGTNHACSRCSPPEPVIGPGEAQDLGKLAIDVLARGDSWDAADVRCAAGPRDRPFDERHGATRIAVVIAGSFQYRSDQGSAVMSPGSLLLGNDDEGFECRHEHGTGDRCVAFEYSPAFFEQAGVAGTFSVPRLPPMTALAPWVVEARRAILAPTGAQFDELAHGLAGAVLGDLGPARPSAPAPSAAS